MREEDDSRHAKEKRKNPPSKGTVKENDVNWQLTDCRLNMSHF